MTEKTFTDQPNIEDNRRQPAKNKHIPARMLIDSSHTEETRVVVVRGNRVDEFDFESSSRRPLRGNIYLAKVTRVEPSLQAAFVDFGGNRHGFLAFSEIHPDYYQIPVADRIALLADEADSISDDAEESDFLSNSGKDAATSIIDDQLIHNKIDSINDGETFADANNISFASEIIEKSSPAEMNVESTEVDVESTEYEQIEQLGGEDDAMEEVPSRSSNQSKRQYKIQEVIKRRQILLVQVVKEERGNKGAALTTYLSLAGRYSVLMPNTARGGGISRKITNVSDRKKLKEIVSGLEVPEGMGIILRTAGASRTDIEIRRDFEYLMRLWESVRSLTLDSTAPTLVYEEGSLIKRAIRDLYTKEVEEIQVSGEEGYREAKDFMRMLMPSHTKVVQHYHETTPIFSRFGVENQLDAMFSSIVKLKSGGYIVINQTEALVSIDVNSGKSTREHNIEDTALKTNLEAAEEIARQLRLRDLAGLIVIDFIDMEEKRNNRAVEKCLNDYLQSDRSRIQVGRISHFGLLEMSRQRIRNGVLESSTILCTHCAGTGLLRSTPSLSLHILRALEDHLLHFSTNDVILKARLEIALYLLNQKRSTLLALEGRFAVSIAISVDDNLLPGQHFQIERGEPTQQKFSSSSTATDERRVSFSSSPIEVAEIKSEIFADVEKEEEKEDNDSTDIREEEGSDRNKFRRRRRRRNGRGNDRPQRDFPNREFSTVEQAQDGEIGAQTAPSDNTETEAPTSYAPPEGRRYDNNRRRRYPRQRRSMSEYENKPYQEDIGCSTDKSDDQNPSEANSSYDDIITEKENIGSFPGLNGADQATNNENRPPRRPRTRDRRNYTNNIEASYANNISDKNTTSEIVSEVASDDASQSTRKRNYRNRDKNNGDNISFTPREENKFRTEDKSHNSETHAEKDFQAKQVEITSKPGISPSENVYDSNAEKSNAPKRSGWWSRAKQIMGRE